MKHEEFQKHFLKGVLVKDIEKELLEDMVPIGELDATQVMGVYQEDYRARLFDVIGENYETCWYVLGDEDFMRIGQEYVEAHPSQYTNLLHYADDFPDFLASRTVEFSFMKTLAEFERSFWSIFHAKDNSIKFSPQELGESIFETPFSLDRNFYLFESEVEISELWRMRKGDGDKSFDEIQNQQYLLLYKRDGLPQIETLSEGNFKLLDNLRNVETIAEAVETIDDELISDPTQWSNFFNFIGYLAQLKS